MAKPKKSEISIVMYRTPNGVDQFRVDTVLTIKGEKSRLRRRGFPTYDAAVEWGETRAAEIRLGMAPPEPRKASRPPRKPKPEDPSSWTTSAVFDRLLKRWEGRLKPISVYTYLSKYRSRIKPIIGDVIFSEVSQDQGQLIAGMDDMSAVIFRIMLRDAPKVGAVVPRICYDPPARKRNPRIVFFEPEEIVLVRDALPEKYRAFFMFLCSTGLRLGEGIALSYQDISLRQSLIHVQRAQSMVPHVIYTTPKSGTGRHVPISAVALEALRERSRMLHGVDWPVVPRGADPLQHLVFNIERTGFRNAMVEAGEAVHLGKMCSPHVCRHTCASLMVQRGVKLEIVGKVLGHKDLATTMVYAHLQPRHLTSGLDILSEAISSAE
ncbi:site-specific integrase [Myxococcota bacterium]|nr:site-specific integrase [Myxococcota bacterium]